MAGRPQCLGLIKAAHGEAKIECHAFAGPQCVGAATYRANVGKLTRGDQLRCSKDNKNVFSTPAEFIEHHERKPKE